MKRLNDKNNIQKYYLINLTVSNKTYFSDSKLATQDIPGKDP